MNIKIISILSFFFLLLALLFKTKWETIEDKGKTHSPKKSLYLNLSSEPVSLDPRRSGDLISDNVTRMLFEGLTRIDSEGTPLPSLAEKIEVLKNKKTYLFFLKESYWSDGTPLTAHDFEYSWKQRLSPNFPAHSVHQMYVIKNAKAAKEGKISPKEIGIKALDNKTLKIDLEFPAPYFLELVSGHSYFPISQSLDKENPDWSLKRDSSFIGNGPFKLKIHKTFQNIILEKNPFFWDHNNVHIDEIKMSIISDSNTELHMFDNNELDWAGAPFSQLPSDAIPALKERNDFHSIPALGICCYKLNTKKRPLHHPKIRKALAYAINREKIITHITQSTETPATGLFPHHINSKKINYFKDYDLEKAKKLFSEALEELEIEKKHFPEIVLSFHTSENNQKIAQTIQQQWREAFGLSVSLENCEWQVYLNKLRSYDYQIGRMGWIGDVNDPIHFLELYKYADDHIYGGNETQWEHPLYQELLDKASFASEKKEREKMLMEAERFLMEEMPIIPLFYISFNYLKKDRVCNFIFAKQGFLDFRHAYLK